MTLIGAVGGVIITRAFGLFDRKTPPEIIVKSDPPKVEVKVEKTPPVIAEKQPGQVIAVPRPNANYIGRAEKLDEVVSNLNSGRLASIVSIGGMGGVGKTETAQVVAHRLLAEGRYKDGAVFVDLQGFSETGQKLSTRAALTRLFDQIGQPLGPPPDHVSEADYAAALTEKWIAETTNKDLLVVLDNAYDEAQAKPLLPGAGATALITSRKSIALPGVNEVRLDRMEDKDALALIRALSPDLGEEDEGAFLDMADGLPLVIETAAPVIAAEDGRTAASKIELFRAAGAVEEGADAIIARLSQSLKAMEREQADDFSGLSQFEGGFFAAGAAVMWDVELEEAERRLAAYHRRNLLISVETDLKLEGTGARWRLHDQLRRAAADWLETAANQTALRRGWGRAAMVTTQQANALYRSGNDAVLAGLALLDLELPTIRAAVAAAGEYAPHDETAAEVTLEIPVQPVLGLRLSAVERIEMLDAAELGLRTGADRANLAVVLGYKAQQQRKIGELAAAEVTLKEVAVIFGDLGDKANQAVAALDLGQVYRRQGELEKAEERFEDAAAMFSQIEDKANQSASLCALGVLYRIRGDLDRAEEVYWESLALERAMGRKEGMAANYGNLGILYRARGDLDRAEEMYRESLALEKALGRKDGMASDYGNLGNLYRDRGDLDEAEEMYLKSLALNEALGQKEELANQYGNLAVLRLDQGRPAEALGLAETAARLFREIGIAHRVEQFEALIAEIREAL